MEGSTEMITPSGNVDRDFRGMTGRQLAGTSGLISLLLIVVTNIVPRILGILLLSAATIMIYSTAAFFLAVLQPEILGSNVVSLALHGSTWGVVHFLVSAYLLVNVLFNFVMVQFVDPGSPTTAAQADDFCSICNMPKPERTHHCSVCDKCILRLDHHCIWLNKCIGERNYRYFWLFLFYMLSSSAYIVLTTDSVFRQVMAAVPLRRVSRCTEQFTFVEANASSPLYVNPATCQKLELSAAARSGIALMFSVTSATCAALLILFGFHVFFALTNRTTIEIMLDLTSQFLRTGRLEASHYNKGWRANLTIMLSGNSLEPLWCLFLPKFAPRQQPREQQSTLSPKD